MLHTNSKCFGFAVCKKSQVSLTDVRFVIYAAFEPNVSIKAYLNVSLVTGTNITKLYMVFLVGKCIKCFSDILTKGLIEGPYTVLMSVGKNSTFMQLQSVSTNKKLHCWIGCYLVGPLNQTKHCPAKLSSLYTLYT